MSLFGNRMAPMLAILALLQTGALAVMVVERWWLIKSGREITLPIVPVRSARLVPRGIC